MRPNSSLRTRDFMAASQRDALDSGDAAKIQAADEAALAEAILASLAEKEKDNVQYNTATQADRADQAGPTEANSVPDASDTRSTMADLRQKQWENTDLLRSWLDSSGFDIVKNRGGGHNDCLLISLLQHATGDYRSEHRAEVKQCRHTLMALDPHIKRDTALASMSDGIGKLIDWLNEDKRCDLRVAIVAPALEGEPTYHFYGNGKRYVVIFDQSGHYEAVVPRRI